MSSSNTPDPPGRQKKRNRFERLWKRIGGLFKKKESTGTSQDPSAPSTGAVQSQPVSKPEPSATQEETPNPAAGPSTKPIIYGTVMQRDKTRALFAKYGLDLDENDWIIRPVDPQKRVEKSIRMRVRRKCHKCQTTFGSQNRICSNCNHRRCQECPRIPPKKKKDPESGTAGEEKKTRPPHEGKPPLTMPSKTGGEDRVHQPIRQRIHRYCHKCQTPFEGKATECAQCKHTRCKRCPRDP